MAGTILGMKPVPLAIFPRNWMRPVNPERGRLIGAMVAVMCAASLVAAAPADTDIPCKLWRFDGYTQFDFSDGGKFTFITFQRFIDFREMVDVLAIPPNGGDVKRSKIWGGIGIEKGGLGNAIWMERIELNGGNDLWFSGGVPDDGFAYGIAFDDRGSSNSWRSAAPLRCADNGG
jgi:hypothetical protein